ncbi:MAG: malto-oligosyltrehalose trehalohydrolase [Flaviflexus sp.]|nr:malto-oligosyltrehalose trehalohydrolase [Flaviflexus sp.]
MRVWAPTGEVELLLPTEAWYGPDTPVRRVEMSREGQWVTAPDLPAGTDYGFSVDGSPLRPDPRSAAQPYGVHGPSRVFDTAAIDWSDENWAGVDGRGALIYELHVGTFTPQGTFASAIERLDYLADLGVQLIELMPIAPFPGNRGWGYDGVSWTAVHEAYGGPAGLAAFVNAAHRAGMGVCLDVVYNHLGPDGNYLGAFGPYFTDRHTTPWGSALNFDGEGSEYVRAHLIDAALRWLRDFHVDALRLDAIHAMIDDSPYHILAELSDRVAELEVELDRPLTLIAESDLNDPKVVTPTAKGGWGMDMQWADDVHHALHTFFTGEAHGYFADFDSEDALEKVMSKVFFHDGTISTFRGQPWGAPVPAEIDGHAFVVYDANHDQIGNRAQGDRPAEHLDRTELAAQLALVLLSPFTPMIFQGEEWGSRDRFAFFSEHADELGKAVSKGRIKEFSTHGWEEIYGDTFDVPDPQAEETFTASKLTWEAKDNDPEFSSFIRALIEIRASVECFASPDRTASSLERSETGLVLHRGAGRVIVNFSEQPAQHPLGTLLSSFGEVNSAETLTVGPRSIAVVINEG